MKPELLDGAPAGSWAECHESGWIQGYLFVLWLKRFIEWSHATKEDPILLLLDGHATHLKNIEVIDLARQNGVVLLCFPPHCTHWIQPLDVGFMKPLSIYYSNEVKKWLRSHPARVVTQFQTAALFGQAFINAATMSTAINAFRATGIWPADADFAPADTIDNQLDPVATTPSMATVGEEIRSVEILTSSDSLIETAPMDTETNNLIETTSQSRVESRTPEPVFRDHSPHPGCSGINNLKRHSFVIYPENIMPIPKL
jgi:hypothetical protein